MSKQKLASCIAVLAGALSGQAFAEPVPDAGQILQQLTPPAAAPAESPSVSLQFPTLKGAPVKPGGPRIPLKAVTFSGNTVFTAAQLHAVIGPVAGKTFDFAALHRLADQIVSFYQAHGYPFVRAFLPPQELDSGILKVVIVEGRYGRVEASGKGRLGQEAQPFLHTLPPGGLIESHALERTMLVLDDQPGMKVVPVIRPGRSVGLGDLEVGVKRVSSYGGDVGIDNTGSRYTGYNRLHASFHADSPFSFGDKVTVNAVGTDENMWFGSLGYERPLGASGMRGNIGYAYTSYELGKDFASLEATGLARISSAGVSYPIRRSQKANLFIEADYQHKDLTDHYSSTHTSDQKSSNNIPVTLRFDNRDRLGMGGITYGSLSWTRGDLQLDADQAAIDAVTANRQGYFSKANFDITRLQRLPGHLALYGRYSTQWANKNLDSSEKIGIGGFYGVRAYPVGEANGDKGWILQSELRYVDGPVAPFVFYDAGKATTNARPWDVNSATNRLLSGAGIGVRYETPRWTVETSAAWRIHGGAATSDPAARSPMFWLLASYRFAH